MRKIALTSALITITIGMSACVTVKEEPPAPVEQVVVIPPQPVRTCIPKSTLKKLVVPAEYKSGFAITSIEVPPDYVTDPETGEVREIINPPIESRTPYKNLIKPEEIFYVDDEDRVITDLCEDDDVTESNSIPDS